ncbi:cupin domain-containing protein [Allobacillus sp. GCM10007491]|uniref:Cupin domain-containing protein n=1 Tax=Allobacillus saliphilus TaxID=2912308 RepID=A0A941CUE1_9BACI|nr:cupin domain-containing protein [Allobacillus saliphilus]MBR7554007.1 cupin domain-containing protein [Allobacillus saliphilus]
MNYGYPQQPSHSTFDCGCHPFVVNIAGATRSNETFRTAIWTGEFFQVTLMAIMPGDDIGLEIHPNTDQFLRIEEGHGFVQIGEHKNQLDFCTEVGPGDAVMVPAGKWHNMTNIGPVPLKLYSIYAPPEHPYGTVHATKLNAMESEQGY